MSDHEKLHETISQLRFENEQLRRFKHLNQLVMNGLDAILCSANRDQVFARLFAVISEILPCDQILIAHYDEQQNTVVPVCSSVKEKQFKPLRYVDLADMFEETKNIFNVELLPEWHNHIGGWMPQAKSVLMHPIHTAQAKYIWLISDNNTGGFSRHYEDVFVSFSAFVANTLSQFEQRKIIREREVLLEERQRIELSMVHQEKMAALGHLAAGVAHELNNPLGFINSNLASLKDYMADLTRFVEAAANASPALTAKYASLDLDFIVSDTADLLEESLQGIRRATDIIHNLKSFSHPDEKTRTELDFNTIITQALSIVRTQSRDVSDIQFVACPQPVRIRVNANQLAQVIINIVTNAVQAVAERTGKVTITLQTTPEMVECRICDNGPGIPKHMKHKIFEPFFTTKSVGVGTGLGLSISKAIIEQYGGVLILESSNADGTCFLIQLPIIRGNH